MSKNQILSSANISDDLRFRLENCGISCNFSGGVGYYSCGAIACSRCARRARARWLVSAGVWMGAARAADLLAVEIEVGLVDRLDALGARIRRFKRDCRNAVWRWRTGGGFRSMARLTGFCGIILGPTGWRLVARFVVNLAGAAAGPLADRLKRIWPDLRIQPVADPVGSAAWCWPDFECWPVEALDWLNSARNLQILRVSIQPKSTRAGGGQHTVDAWSDEPMPISF